MLLNSVAGVRAAEPDEATSAARLYVQSSLAILERIEGDLPHITAAAELAARSFVGGHDLTARGGKGLVFELAGRSGGLVSFGGDAAAAGDVVLYAFGIAPSEQPNVAELVTHELEDAERLQAKGIIVIGVASREQLRDLGLLERANRACAMLLDNHASSRDGVMMTCDSRPIIPSSTVADAAVGWAWTAELFAACTRLGQTPIMYKSFYADRGRERAALYVGQRFHKDFNLTPIEPGKLAASYLSAIRELLTTIQGHELPAIQRAADRAAETLIDGGQVYIVAQGHYPSHHHGGQLAMDPKLFTRMNVHYDKFLPVEPTEDDMVVAIGYCYGPSSPDWGETALMRRAGRGIAWVIASYNTPAYDIADDEILIEQHWTAGDAAVAVKGYDIAICPPSGITSEVLMWMIQAQTYAELVARGQCPDQLAAASSATAPAD
jgi:uncharacterized phosphosugar-binding protein